MASTTTTFLKSRVSKPTPGKWSSGFSAVKKYAETNKIPLIAVWSNGDACGHCVNFEKSCMQSAFTKWMATSGCVFWFGCSSDKTADDKFEGTGFKWCYNNGAVTTYPLTRVYWKAGKVDVSKSGGKWTGDTASGGSKFVSNLKTTLKKFFEQQAAAKEDAKPTDECEGGNCDTTDNGCNGGNCNTDTNCDGGNCSPDNGCCEDAKKALEEVKADLAKLTEKVAEIEKKVASCCNA